MTKYKSLKAIAAVALVSAAAGASADPIALFNTGVDAAGNVRGNGAAELHYSIASSPSASPMTARVLTDANGYPAPPWLGDDSLSAWVVPAGASDGSGPYGYYTYTTTFDLTGLNAATATISGAWSTDNYGTDILVNGVSTGFGANGFGSFYGFSLTSGFTSGINTLSFVVLNGGGPTGLRVEMSGTADVPEPAMLGLFGMGALLLAGARRKR